MIVHVNVGDLVTPDGLSLVPCHCTLRYKQKTEIKCMLLTGREVRIGKNCGLGLQYTLDTEGTVFPNTDQPRPVNNIFIYLKILFLGGTRNY